MAWDATSHEGNEAVLDSGWATARPAGAIGSRDGRPRGSPLREPRRRVVRGRRGDPCGRPCRFPRWPRSGRYGTPQWRGTPPRTKETKPCWIRDGRPRALRAREGRGMGDREGRPYASLVAELFGAVGATLVVAHAGFPDGLVRVGTGRRNGVGRHLARRKRSRAGFGMGDRAPCGRDRVAGWATARVAPTWASSPSCSGVGATLVVAHACRRPCRFPDGLVWVGTGRHEGVGRHKGVPYGSARLSSV